MKKPDKGPIDLDAARQAELREMEAAVARGGTLPTWAEIIIGRAMREGFSDPDAEVLEGDPTDDGPVAA